MVDIAFWHKLSPRKRPHDNKRLRSRKSAECFGSDGAASRAQEDASVQRRKRSLSNQILKISGDSFNRGASFLNARRYDEARECFEDALAARLVLYGPDSEQVLAVHFKLKKIAEIQGDVRKAAHHRLKILQLSSSNMPYKQSGHDPVDWSILSSGD